MRLAVRCLEPNVVHHNQEKTAQLVIVRSSCLGVTVANVRCNRLLDKPCTLLWKQETVIRVRNGNHIRRARQRSQIRKFVRIILLSSQNACCKVGGKNILKAANRFYALLSHMDHTGTDTWPISYRLRVWNRLCVAHKIRCSTLIEEEWPSVKIPLPY